ncbi:pathogenesis-related leaf protein 4-like [Magnolia sinica]|uniref:pathogenesis-related leaf protein 4-like n=1 Tax=Magnolia sinica TaxID=86752 RepID=UPI002659B277|nr:pathogenesis-related leaf protein 4-like [Magnolia sinica]
MALSSLALAWMYVTGLPVAHVTQAQNTAQDFLGVHNSARVQVGVGNMAWDTTIHAFISGLRIFQQEAGLYDNPPAPAVVGKAGGHYTQVVWRNSVQLSCKWVQCNSNGIFIICNYYLHGNLVG